MIRLQLTPKTAETLSSFLTTAAERFKDDAALIRAELKGKKHAGLEAIAWQFDAQEKETRAMAEQFADLFEVDTVDDLPTIDPGEPLSIAQDPPARDGYYIHDKRG